MRVQDVVLDGACLPVEENGSAIQVDGRPSRNLPRPDELRRMWGQGAALHVAESEWPPLLPTRSSRLNPAPRRTPTRSSSGAACVTLTGPSG